MFLTTYCGEGYLMLSTNMLTIIGEFRQSTNVQRNSIIIICCTRYVTLYYIKSATVSLAVSPKKSR